MSAKGRTPGSGESTEDRRQELVERCLEGLDRVSAKHWRQGAGARINRRELSLAQIQALMLLSREGSIAVGRLAAGLGVTMPSASAVLDHLQEHGLVERRRDAADHRVVHAALTPSGRQEAEEIAGFRRQQARRVLAQFETEELEGLLQVLAATSRAISELTSPL